MKNQYNIESKLAELGLELPIPPEPAGDYVPFRQVGNLLFCAGVLSIVGETLVYKGAVGSERTVEEGFRAAEVCALNVLANIKSAIGDLDRVKQIVFVGGFVNAVVGFEQSPQVINGASQLFGKLFGEAGKHARAAVSVSGLPANATVEIQVNVEIETD